MKLHYYPETDSLYIELKSAPGAETREIAEGLLVDFDAKGEAVPPRSWNGTCLPTRISPPSRLSCSAAAAATRLPPLASW
jgi:uncharacterized protein YuzE